MNRQYDPQPGFKDNDRLQLMRPALLMPFVQYMDKLGTDCAPLLAQYQHDRQSIKNNRGLIAGAHVHAFLEGAAQAARRPFLGWQVGNSLDHWRYSLLQDSLVDSNSIGDVLIRLVNVTDAHATATSYHLSIDSQYSWFWELRHYRSSQPGQADAFTLGLLYSLLEQCTGEDWSPREVLLETTDPELIPRRIAARVAASPPGIAIRMTLPTGWLRKKLIARPVGLSNIHADEAINVDVKDYVEDMLRPHLADPDLDSHLAAAHCGASLQALNRELAPQDSSVSKVLRTLRLATAAQALAESDASQADIARDVGYRNVASFSRAFARWAEQSPGSYRTQAGR